MAKAKTPTTPEDRFVEDMARAMVEVLDRHRIQVIRTKPERKS